LISVYNINTGNSENVINYIITALSILVLVVSQFENAQEYKLNARIFHDCGLELSLLYNDLRVFKTLKKKPSEYETYYFAKNLSEKYQTVLRNYQNHSTIDYDMFLINNVNYIEKVEPEKITSKNIKKVKCRYLWEIYGWYSIMIITPPILILAIIS